MHLNIINCIYTERSFKIYSDHKPIVNLLNNPNSIEPLHIEKMTLRLQGYLFDLQHVKGENNISDYPSRHPIVNQPTDDEIKQYVNFVSKHTCPNALSINDICNVTQKDPVLQIVADLICQNSWCKLDQSNQYPAIKDHL